jgi:opacity protein-like surface antigen
MSQPPPRPVSSRRTAAALLSGALAAALLLLAPSRAEAYEKQWHAGVSLGYVALMGPNPTRHGLGGGLHLTYGLTDAFNLMVEAEASGQFGRDAAPPPKKGEAAIAAQDKALLTRGGVGIGYVFDVLQWVPYVGLVPGVADIVNLGTMCGAKGQVPCHDLRFDLAVPFGLDYNVSRSLSVGVGGRYQMLISGQPLGHVLGVFARAEYVWGY